MFRFTEQELRDFLNEQSKYWDEDALKVREYDEYEPYDYGYSIGAHEAYEFVLRFLEEYKAEEDR